MAQQTRVTFLSAGLTLEGVYSAPDHGSPRAAVVVCHPHPQYGGDMDNNVVAVIVQSALDAGISALAFNFRGAGASQGAFDNGRGEREDVRAAVAFTRALAVDRVLLAGYSFGAGMSAAAVDASITALALVALPAGMARADGAGMATYEGPVLMISGDADSISKASDLESLTSSLPSHPALKVVSGADHFWWGHEKALANELLAFFKENA
ncbi:MAG TPA: alpha/beta hydrolase [Dehalococcoidia bacterium]